ncbi:MAG: hypothetical protein C0613_12675, partial [Desulfobulbaceae bacterium]
GKGQGARGKGQGARGKGQGASGKGQGARGKGQGARKYIFLFINLKQYGKIVVGFLRPAAHHPNLAFHSRPCALNLVP